MCSCCAESMDTTSPLPSPQQKHLLRLPAELRNRIYRLSILRPEGERIQIGASGCATPGLLATCGQIRLEALPIFYLENQFEVVVHNFDSDPLLRWHKELHNINTTITPSLAPECWTLADFSSVSWKNLLVWVQRYHARLVHGRLPTPEVSLKRHMEGMVDVQWFVIGGLFSTAKELRSQPWEVVERVIRVQRPVLIRLDERWAVD